MVNSHKKTKAMLRGLVITWQDSAPLDESSEVIPGKITHKNPVYRLVVQKMWRDHGEFITSSYPMRWLIKITVVFDYPNNTRQLEERELEARSTITDLNDYCMDAIRDAMRCGDAECYQHTEFEVECVG